MSKFGLDTDVLEKLCKEHDLLLSDPLLNLISDVIEIACNEEKVITAKIKYNYDLTRLSSSFLEHHSSSWSNPDSPTPLELEESIKDEVYSWLNDLGIDVEFKKESEHDNN
tara:strand:- start:143 stop:475 length:333 start_codon:yes stop_codon:yes gene_type:complete